MQMCYLVTSNSVRIWKKRRDFCVTLASFQHFRQFRNVGVAVFLYLSVNKCYETTPPPLKRARDRSRPPFLALKWTLGFVRALQTFYMHKKELYNTLKERGKAQKHNGSTLKIGLITTFLTACVSWPVCLLFKGCHHVPRSQQCTWCVQYYYYRQT